MDKNLNILGDLVHHMKYAKYDESRGRRETYDETVDRNQQMHVRQYPKLREEIVETYKLVRDKKVIPSMRSMQFAGVAIDVNPSRIFNCSYLPVTSIDAFNETMFLLLSGCGVGYSVQRHHVEQLPEIRKPIASRRYLIQDSIEGWADAIKVLMRSYFADRSLPLFDYRAIREKGAQLVISGGKAPGPDPLRKCLNTIQTMLERKQNGDKLSTLEAHDIQCIIADAVLAGGIRRSALIRLFSIGDDEMLPGFCVGGSCELGFCSLDDEKDIRLSISDLLLDENYSTRLAANSDEALSELSKGLPDLILLDIWLEGSKLDGLELLNQIHLFYPSIPCIIISGHGNIDIAVKAIKGGASDFIEKPFESERLLIIIERVLEIARLKKENRELWIRSGGPIELIGSSNDIKKLKIRRSFISH